MYPPGHVADAPPSGAGSTWHHLSLKGFTISALAPLLQKSSAGIAGDPK